MVKKVVLLIGCCLLLLSGCSTKPKNGKIVQIGIDDVFAKMDKKESFVLMVSRDGCEFCALMHKMLNHTMEDHNTVIYNVKMDDSTYDKLVADKNKLEKRLNDPGTTPHMYNIKDGKVKDDFVGFDEDKPMAFWDWIKKNKLEDAK